MSTETSLSDKVRPLEVKMVGKESIKYYYFMVDFAKADGIEVSSSELTLKEGTENEYILQITCSLTGSVDESKTKSYLVNYFEQVPSEDVLVEVEITVSGVTKKGDVKTAKLKSRDEKFEESENLDHPRYLVVQSQTTEEYMLIIWAKTVNTNSKTLNLTAEASGENTDLKISYNSPADHNPSHASSGFLVASNSIDSTNGQFYEVYKKTDDKVTIDYSNPSPTIL